MLTIRLQRTGKKNQPAFRLILTEKTNPVKGKFQEILGSYNPRTKVKKFEGERIKYWISKGAQASATAHNLLVKEGLLSGAKVKAWRPKKKEKGEEKPAPAEKKEEKAAA